MQIFFSKRGIDINDPDAYDKMKDINSTFAKQVLAYQQRSVVDDINKRTRDAVEAQRIQRELEEAAKAKSKAAALAAIKKQGQADFITIFQVTKYWIIGRCFGYLRKIHEEWRFFRG